MSDLWYYAEANTTNGPLGSEELVEFLKQKPGAGDIFVWQQGFSDWVQAASVPELARLLLTPLPPTIHITY
jgi:GYF domain 2